MTAAARSPRAGRSDGRGTSSSTRQRSEHAADPRTIKQTKGELFLEAQDAKANYAKSEHDLLAESEVARANIAAADAASGMHESAIELAAELRHQLHAAQGAQQEQHAARCVSCC